jgi:hypothetical protein
MVEIKPVSIDIVARCVGGRTHAFGNAPQHQPHQNVVLRVADGARLAQRDGDERGGQPLQLLPIIFDELHQFRLVPSQVHRARQYGASIPMQIGIEQRVSQLMLLGFKTMDPQIAGNTLGNPGRMTFAGRIQNDNAVRCQLISQFADRSNYNRCNPGSPFLREVGQKLRYFIALSQCSFAFPLTIFHMSNQVVV